ncbi:uncharacterized protein LOC143630573 [Bidens hawaiensis]|uniref:uncharacterized protein LOC143630573 n=1 Tax=Bidens hawaiensis TaxID=980011 RepID=UPI004049E398
MQDFKEKRKIKLAPRAAAGDVQLTGDRMVMEADIVKPDNLLPLAAGERVGHSTWVDMTVAHGNKMEMIVDDHKVKEQNLTNELDVSRKELEEKDEQLKAAVTRLKQREADLAKMERDSSSTIGALTGDVACLKEERRWLITEGIPRSFEVIRGSVEFRNAIAELAASADFVGRQDGMRDGIKLQRSGKRIEEHEHYKVDAEGDLANAYQTFSDVSFPMMEELVSTADHEDLDTLKALLASPIHDGSE